MLLLRRLLSPLAFARLDYCSFSSSQREFLEKDEAQGWIYHHLHLLLLRTLSRCRLSFPLQARLLHRTLLLLLRLLLRCSLRFSLIRIWSALASSSSFCNHFHHHRQHHHHHHRMLFSSSPFSRPRNRLGNQTCYTCYARLRSETSKK